MNNTIYHYRSPIFFPSCLRAQIHGVYLYQIRQDVLKDGGCIKNHIIESKSIVYFPLHFWYTLSQDDIFVKRHN